MGVEPKDANIMKSKDPQVWEMIKWQIEGAQVPQSTWVASLLTDEGNPSWLTNPRECIRKYSTSFKAKF